MVPVDFRIPHFNDSCLAAYSQPSAIHDGDLSEGSFRGVCQDQDACSQIARLLFEADGVQTVRFGGVLFHIYDIPPPERFSGGKLKGIWGFGG